MQIFYSFVKIQFKYFFSVVFQKKASIYSSMACSLENLIFLALPNSFISAEKSKFNS